MAKNRRTVKKSRTARKRQNGGVAPVSYSIPFGQRQPTEAIMERATTAGGGGGNSGDEDTNPSEVTIVNNRVVKNRTVNNSTIQTNPSQVNVAKLTKSPPVSYLKNTTLRNEYVKQDAHFKQIIFSKLNDTLIRILKSNSNPNKYINNTWGKGPGLIINECLDNKIPVEKVEDILFIYIDSYRTFTEPLRSVGYSESRLLESARDYAIQEARKAINNYKNGKPLVEGLGHSKLPSTQIQLNALPSAHHKNLTHHFGEKPPNSKHTDPKVGWLNSMRSIIEKRPTTNFIPGGKYKHTRRNKRRGTRHNKRN